MLHNNLYPLLLSSQNIKILAERGLLVKFVALQQLGENMTFTDLDQFVSKKSELYWISLVVVCINYIIFFYILRDMFMLINYYVLHDFQLQEVSNLLNDNNTLAKILKRDINSFGVIVFGQKPWYKSIKGKFLSVLNNAETYRRSPRTLTLYLRALRNVVIYYFIFLKI